jgi:hypothetical protein
LDFLQAVADPPQQQIATDPWWLTVIKPSPFAAEFIEARVVQRVR